MPLKLLVNSIWQRALQVKATDTANTDTADQTGIISVIGGPRHLKWTQTGTADRRIVYVNKAGGLSFDSFVMTRADRHVSKGYKLHSYATYPAAPSVVESSGTWAPTLIGPSSQDYVTTGLAVSNVQAVGIELTGAYQKSVSQLYFCNSITLSYPEAFVVEPFWGDFQIKRQNYKIQERGRLVVRGITLAEVQAFESLYKVTEEPVFLHDAAGRLLPDKLWHCLLTYSHEEDFSSSLHTLTLDLYRLRHYV